MTVLDLSAGDGGLIDAIAQGDVDAFTEFYDRHAALAFSLAMRILRDQELAEEATQDAFVCIWRNRMTYESARASPTTWLLSIMHHRATDRWREERRQPARAYLSDGRLANFVAADDVEGQVIAREQKREIVARLVELPVSQRMIRSPIAVAY